MFTIPSGIKAIIFDCDGTLVDSMPLHLEAWRNAFELNGRDFPEEYIDSQKGANALSIIKAYNEKYNDDLDPEKVAMDKKGFVGDSLKNVKPIEPVVNVAKEFYGKLPISVVSGGSRYNVENSLTSTGIINMFHPIITSTENFPPKPNPASFLEAARIMDVEAKDCLVFEDGDLGIEAAVSAGMKFIDVRDYL